MCTDRRNYPHLIHNLWINLRKPENVKRCVDKKSGYADTGEYLTTLLCG